MSLRTSAAYVAVRMVSGLLAMATLALVVRGLGPEAYGQLSLGLALAAAVTLVLFNPLNATLARFHAEPAQREANLCLLRRLLLGIGGGLLLLSLLLEAAGLQLFAGGLLVAAACMALSQGMFDFSGQHLAASQQSRRYAVQFLAKAVGSLCGCALVLRAGGGPVAVLLAMAAAFLAAALMAGPVWRRAGERVSKPSDRRELLAFGGPLLLTSLLGYLLLWGDRYLLERLVPLAELGRYSALTDLAQQTLGLVFSGLCSAWYPRLVLAFGAGDRAEAQRLYERYAALGLAACLPAGVGFALLLPDILRLLYGEAFVQVPAALPALVSASAMIAGVKAYYLDQALLLGKRVWWHAASIALAAGGGLLLAALLVPHAGIAGAAAGLLTGQLAGAGLSLLGGHGVLLRRCPRALCWPPVAGCALMVPCLLAWPAGGWLAVMLRVLTGALVYATVMWLADFDGVRARLMRRFR
ncbi:lipopolysaccharide biosynthesis protein [Uliginosibacterium paludis]|uniref:Oligosaccharide flippase family protein n=1 Tax=Uliginosibacterium paludis TaxID=1615952 RepID=A0ABV2CJX3_9RHOO